MRNRIAEALSIVVLLAGSSAVSAQDVIDRNTFEVASIHPAGIQALVPCSGGFELTSGRITFIRATVIDQLERPTEN